MKKLPVGSIKSPVGSIVLIPCKVKPGMRADERFVRIERKADDPIVGFIDKKWIVEKNGAQFIVGSVFEWINDDQLRVFMQGELSTNNIPSFLRSDVTEADV